MTEREAFEMREKIERKAEDQDWLCAECDRSLHAPGAVLQWAHGFPQTDGNIAKYGEAVVHHPLNGKVVCSLKCNQTASRRNEPLWEAQMVRIIRETIKREGT